MRSRALQALALSGVAAACVVLSPATSSAAPLATNMAHVNSNIAYTWLYVSPYGDTHYNVQLGPCVNFYYDGIVNGRYNDITHGGWVSTDRAGSGWC
ncbi:hypothetical protein [Labedaea rhizosphaerae]|uniref:Uncharacterized protein n=1 Tax=Labedaea rhizosphaerae TaxID=598644 RepID=A0A4R6SCB6_LABRH|nr:hypothetical protein [Labedaea rhizosphaerae]TDP97592.1 hypothetical protein EV186_103556 [Labedaea rhizosphaerae]